MGVAAGLGLVAALDLIAPIASLGVVPLLVVLALAVHRGQLAALAAAVLSVLGLNYFFIPPVHRLTIADDENVVALGVLLDTLIVRSVLVTALTLDIGDRIWWPSRLARRHESGSGPGEQAVEAAVPVAGA